MTARGAGGPADHDSVQVVTRGMPPCACHSFGVLHAPALASYISASALASRSCIEVCPSYMASQSDDAVVGDEAPAASMDPSHVTVGTHEAIVGLAGRGLAATPDRLGDPGAVLLIDQCQEAGQVGWMLAGRDPRDPAQLIRPADDIRLDVPLE